MGTSSSSDTCSSIENSINSQIFMPPKVDPDHYKLYLNSNRSQLLTTNTKDETIISFVVIKPLNVFSKYIIFSHGNGSDIYGMFNYAKKLCDTYNVGCILYDYPGYGLSEGIPTEKGCYSSLESVVNYVKNNMKIDDKNIILVGQSLGTGVVIDYACKHNWNYPIILISPYKSIISVVYDSSITKPIDKFKSLEKIKIMNCPIKIIHGESDNLIDISHGKTLYDNLNNKRFKPTWIPNVGHNDILNNITYEDLYEVINFDH